MKMNKEVTKVIFRKFDDGEVIAVFPEELGDSDYLTCSSYMHVGQHGSANIHAIKNLKSASEKEYSSLLTELTGLGYTLKIYKKFSRKMTSIREDKAFQIEHKFTHGT